MKKVSSVMLLLATMFLVLSACSKDDDYSIIDTKWEASEYGTLISLQFGGNGNARFVKKGTDIDEVNLYTYKLDYPKVILYPTESWAVTLNAVITNNIMTVENPTIITGSKIIHTLKKQ